MNLIDLRRNFYDLQGQKDRTEIYRTLSSGDVVEIHEKIIDEKKKERIQKFQGILIRKRGSLLNESVLLRSKFKNFWVERSFFIHSPLVHKISKIKEGRSRRSRLYYLRDSKFLSDKLKRLKLKSVS